MKTVIIYTGPHYPANRHEVNKCDDMLADSLLRMAKRHGWPTLVKEGGKQ